MSKDLTNSPIDRQNILNNGFALEEIKKATNIKGIELEGSMRLTKEQIALFFNIDIRTLERYIEKFGDELSVNGYEVLKGQRLNKFREEISKQFVTGIDVGHKVRNLAIFEFRSFLNLAMLLSESDNARILRQTILDIVIDIINEKTGGATKYINQRDEDFLIQIIKEENYRKKFTDALDKYVAMGNIKYAIYTNKVYQAIFNENANEYREILKLDSKENIRHTMYSEILALIAGFENGVADMIEQEYLKNNKFIII